VLTRTSNEMVDLHKRVDISRENKADLFISLHMGAEPENQEQGNESDKKYINGFDVLVSNKMPPYQQKSEVFGSLLEKQISSIYVTNPNLLKRETGIWVLDHNFCPAVILDCGYITNVKDRDFISKEANREVVATKILSAII